MDKRKRSVNFTQDEMDVLVELVIRYKNIVESKKTDAETWREKSQAWDNIEYHYNSSGDYVHRTAQTLKSKYEALKKNVKKKYLNWRASVIDEGSTKLLRLTPLEEKVKGLISLPVEDLRNSYDSDSISEQKVSEVNPEIIMHFTEEKPNILREHPPETNTEESENEKWTKWESMRLKRKKVPAPSKPPEKRRFEQPSEEKIAEQDEQGSEIVLTDEAQLKMNILRREQEIREREHELRILILQTELEEHKVKIEILKYELELKKKELGTTLS